MRTAWAEEAAAETSSFHYQHSPLYNPTAMRDVVENPDAVYGFSPNPDAGSLTGYAAYDWTDSEVVADARAKREAYLEQDKQLYDQVKELLDEGAGLEQVAREASAKRNALRLAAYEEDPEGLAIVKARNLEKYGNEEGPTPEWLFEKYGSWEEVLDNVINTNPGMDACCGLYDDNWDRYVYFGQIAKHTVAFDTAGHGEAPQSQEVYAGELATEPEAPTADGMVFEGWSAEGSDEAFDFSAAITEDVKLVATWSEESAPAPGTAHLDIVVADDLPVVGADISVEAADLLSEEDLARVAAGEDARVWLDIKASSASDEVRASVLKAARDASADMVEPILLDIDLYKRLTHDEADASITELADAVDVALHLADDQVPADADTRAWFVICVHGDEVTKLDVPFDAETKTVSFSTAAFSTFAVAYGAPGSAVPEDPKDPTDGEDPTEPADSEDPTKADQTAEPEAQATTSGVKAPTWTFATTPLATSSSYTRANSARAPYATRTSASTASATRTSTLAATGDLTNNAALVALVGAGACAVLIGKNKTLRSC